MQGRLQCTWQLDKKRRVLSKKLMLCTLTWWKGIGTYGAAHLGNSTHSLQQRLSEETKLSKSIWQYINDSSVLLEKW